MTQAPLPSETRYWRRAEDRQRVVDGLFDRAAEHYDRACDIMSFGGGQRYRRGALERAGLRSGMTVLDVGIGTGLLAREIVRVIGPAGCVMGVDPSLNMLVQGRAHLHIPLVQGVGERLPFPDGRFDFITMGYALRHVSDFNQAFEEYRRVLKPGGRVLLLEITRPASSLGMALARVYFGTVVPAATRIATRSADASELMRFYWDTILRCVPPDAVIASLERSGFARPQRSVLHGIFSEYTAFRDV